MGFPAPRDHTSAQVGCMALGHWNALPLEVIFQLLNRLLVAVVPHTQDAVTGAVAEDVVAEKAGGASLA